MNSINFGESPQMWKKQATNNTIRSTQGNNMNAASLLMSQQQQGLSQQQQQQQSSLAFTSQNAAQRAVLQVLARDKRRREETLETPPSADASSTPSKKQRTEEKEIAPVLPSEQGLTLFNDNDVLSGRGGGTNVHPGNRLFRDLINRNRRAYLKARKNDKPGISRAIVKRVRENGGRFLKREEGSNLWFEIGDDAAREKTSQALRQRAPEMRKVLFESEIQQARLQVEQLQQKQRLLNSLSSPLGFPQPGLSSPSPAANNRPLNPFVAMTNKSPFPTSRGQNSDAYAQYSQNLMTAALLGGGINRITPHGA